jgi:4-hydroxy-2-oxoheptanedioate aldolase
MNSFKVELAGGRTLFGLWQSLASPYSAEVCAGAGFDWLLFDGEHAPNTIQTMLAQLQAVSRFPVEPIARLPVGDAIIIKQYLDIGFRTLLVPMVENADQARQLVAATRFPPLGVRGVASTIARASGFGARADYLQWAHKEICLIAQIESRAALEAIDAIAAVEGIDALFIGPADLAASLGYLGNPAHPDVQDAIAYLLERITAAGKPSGIFAISPVDARARAEQGVRFISVGSDIGILSSGTKAAMRL